MDARPLGAARTWPCTSRSGWSSRANAPWCPLPIGVVSRQDGPAPRPCAHQVGGPSSREGAIGEEQSTPQAGRPPVARPRQSRASFLPALPPPGRVRRRAASVDRSTVRPTPPPRPRARWPGRRRRRRRSRVHVRDCATNPPATAASSPKAILSAPIPDRPYPVSETHTLVRPAVMISAGMTPRWRSARGREPSITTSAAASTRRSAARPSTEPKSRATLSCPPCSKSKKAAGPRRAPSGRSMLSTLMTRAPPSPRTWPHNGPAQSDERSATTRSPMRGGGSIGPEYGTANVAGPPGLGSASSARARPRSAPRSTRSRRGRSATNRARSDQSSSSAFHRPGSASSNLRCVQPASVSSQAGSDATSSGRTRATASQPSPTGNKRVDPPQLVCPRRASPPMAARSPNMASGSTSTSEPRSRLSAAMIRPRPSTATVTSVGANRGSSGQPVNAIAPDAAHASSGSPVATCSGQSARVGGSRTPSNDAAVEDVGEEDRRALTSRQG